MGKGGRGSGELMKNFLRGWAVVVVGLALSSCATVTRGTRDTLVVESEPSGARVSLSTGERGVTPTSFNLARKQPVTVTLEKFGYETAYVNVTPTVVGAGGAGMAGNILLGGVIGAAVDIGTGSMNDLRPNPVRVKLNLAGPKKPAREVFSF